jgi:hypothetical protein
VEDRSNALSAEGGGEGEANEAPSAASGDDAVDDESKGMAAAAGRTGPGAEVEAEKVKVRAGIALKAVKEMLLLVGGGARKSD